MKLSFYGAAREVTGSCHWLQACGKNILVDCGMEQSGDAKTPNALPLPANKVDYVLLTHAHIDHSGRLPLLAKQGFTGTVYTTDSTADLCGIMLKDSAHIQEFEAEWRNRKGKRAGDEGFEPLYTMEDAENILKCFEKCNYGDIIEICPGIKVRFSDVGHLLGSACIEVWVQENGQERKLVFSGDVGNINQPLIKDPSFVTQADYVLIESTYGERRHSPPPDYAVELARIINSTFDRGGNVVIPSFAVGRTQEVLYYIRRIKEQGLVKGHGDFPVYVDSPLAVEATNIFTSNRQDYDDEACSLVERGINPITFSSLKLSVSSDQSKLINEDTQPKVILSASGMCDAGRIKHHLKHNLWREESTIVFVGYQANGTLGRILLDGAPSVKIFGERIKVAAQIVRLEGLSAHADCDGLIRWLDAFSPCPKHIFVVHGSEEAAVAFGAVAAHRYGCEVSVPYYGEGYDLIKDALVDERIPQQAIGGLKETRADTAYARLIAAAKRLLGVAEKNKGGTNKNLAKFTSQINSLAEKWDD